MQQIDLRKSNIMTLPFCVVTLGTLGWLGCHVVKLINPASLLQPMGCAVGIIVALPLAALGALVFGSCLSLMCKNHRIECYGIGLLMTYPIAFYLVSQWISTTEAIPIRIVMITLIGLSAIFGYISSKAS